MRHLGWSAIVAAEAVFFTILVDYWADGAVPQGALRESAAPPCPGLWLTCVLKSYHIPGGRIRHIFDAEHGLCLVRMSDFARQDFPILDYHIRIPGASVWRWTQGLRP